MDWVIPRSPIKYQEGVVSMTMVETQDTVVGSGTGARKSRGRSKSVENGSRLHLYMPDSLVKRLQEIQRDTHAASLTEVVKSALQLYAAAVEEHKNGGHVYLKRKDDGVERQLALFI
jgi:predicted AAA+ superfamily ATPase